MTKQECAAAVDALNNDIKQLSGTMKGLHLRQLLTPERQEYYSNNIAILKAAIKHLENSCPVS